MEKEDVDDEDEDEDEEDEDEVDEQMMSEQMKKKRSITSGALDGTPVGNILGGDADGEGANRGGLADNLL